MASEDSQPPDGGQTSLGNSPNVHSDRPDRISPDGSLLDTSRNPNDRSPHEPPVGHQGGGVAAASPSVLSKQPQPDRTSPVGGDTHPNKALGFQQATTRAGAFPKISANFDKPVTALDRQPPLARNIADKRIKENVRPAGGETSKKQQTKSFAEAAALRSVKPPDMFAHNFNAIKPVKLNDGLTIIMPAAIYEKRLASFQFALIGRLMLPQGSTPRSVDNLKEELTNLFKVSEPWTLMPLGKGFYSLKFSLQEDQAKAARQTSWKLSAGFLQIRSWKPDFNPYKELSSTAQIWVRLFHLPTEYWDPEFLVGIFRSVGNETRWQYCPRSCWSLRSSVGGGRPDLPPHRHGACRPPP